MANINSVLKIDDTVLSFNILYKKIIDKLSMYFNIDKELFKNIIIEMIDKEYICGPEQLGDFSLIKKLIY